MEVLHFMTELKNKLLSNENKEENLAEVVKELTSFYKKVEISEPKILFSKKITDELYLIANDVEYTELAKKVKLDGVKDKLLSVINDVIESAIVNESAVVVSDPDAIKKVGTNKLMIVFQLFRHFKFKAVGIGNLAVRLTFYLGLLIVGCIILSVIKPPKPPQITVDHKLIAATLYKYYSGKLEFYNKRKYLLANRFQKEPPGNFRNKYLIKTEIIATKVKLDSLQRVILPQLDFIKNNTINSARRSKLDAYTKILKNY